MESQTASARATPTLDEATFQQILEAAYILQEQNLQEKTPSKPARLQAESSGKPASVGPKLGAAETLAEIAAAQEVLHSNDYDLATAARVIAEQLLKITNATGVAVAVINDDALEYLAAVGSAASLAGLTIPVDESMSAFLQTDKVDLRRAAEFLQSQGRKSPVLFPVHHDGKVAGLLDLRFNESLPIQEHELGSCQVMAGLMGEAIARSHRADWKRALATERATMLEVLERLRPQLERLASEPAEPARSSPAAAMNAIDELFAEKGIPAPEIQEPPPASELEALASAIGDAGDTTSAISICAQCGYRFREGELFCGRCGTPRSMEMVSLTEPKEECPAEQINEPSATTEEEAAEAEPENPEGKLRSISDAALPPELQQALIQFERAEAPQFERAEVPQTDGSSALAPAREEPAPVMVEDVVEEAEGAETLEPDARPEIVQPAQELSVPAPSPWDSARKALTWFKSLEKTDSPGRIWLAKHRGDLSVAISAIVLLLALSGVGSRTMQHRPKNPSQPALTLFERVLVSLGLAEEPPASVVSGDPNVQVWVDVHTALYYCPGADLYGNTPDGKTETQRDAQLDQFQPAARENCK